MISEKDRKNREELFKLMQENPELHDLKPVFLKCKCGSVFKYKTNVSEEVFDFPCLKCGNPVDLQLNKRGNAYVTIGE